MAAVITVQSRGSRNPDSRSLNCPSCKVTTNLSENRSRYVCSYCGSYFDPNLQPPRVLRTPLSSARTARSATHATSLLPAVNRGTRRGSSSNSNKDNKSEDDGAINSLLMSSLTSLTLGSLASQKNVDKLPQLETNGHKKLVQIGSGNHKENRQSPSLKLNEVKPVKEITNKTFKSMLITAKSTKDFSEIQDFYSETFRSYRNICQVFKSCPEKSEASFEGPELKNDFMYLVIDSIKSLNVSSQKSVIRSIVNCILDDSSPPVSSKDRARALYLLIQVPLFSSQATYTILAHLLQQITRLSNADHQLLVHWFRTTPTEKLRLVIQNLLQFITIRQFPPADKSLPPLNRSRWWIPTAVKVLALINASNNLKNPPMLAYTEFYNISLDHMDLMQEYYTWQNPERANQFSYCQYPFILSIVAKQHILTKDSEQQMILTARRSLVQKMARHQQPQIEIFFLNISVRRDNLVEDSLKEITEKQKDLKKKLKISFINEPGLDMGGLTKEWFQLLIKRIFEPEYGMFVYYPHSRCYWFSVSKKGNLREYNLIGVLMGLAVYNSIILDLHFPSICYRKLLTPPVVPPDVDCPVGIVPNPTLEDLAEIMPDVAQSLKETLDYNGSIEDDLMVSFQASFEEYGKVITYDLKPDGKNELVTNDTKDEFVRLYLDWLLNTQINDRFRAFYLGFHSVCASNALIMLRPEEVEQLVCGSQTFDLAELKKVTFYDGYKADDLTIQHFWEVLDDYSEDLQQKFLLFTTGSDRVPVGGTSDMTMKISRMKDRNSHHLPIAHTCFNQLVLPDYKSKDTLKRKLTIAISNAEGFGIE